MNCMKLGFAKWLLLLFLLPTALPIHLASAQGVTTAAINGTITDESGAPLPGVNVVATHEPTGTSYGTATQPNGRYTLLNLQSGGPYTVEASFIGFRVARETGINLTLGQTRELDFELQEATVELGEVEVVGTTSSVLNSERTGASTNVDEQTIERLPTITRSLSDFARLTPQATGGNSLAGRNNRYNNIQIDGATLNDVFGLSGTGAPGGQAGTQPISLDAIQEFNVDIAPYDVRYNGFTGGSLNAITKSGTNAFEGSLRFLGRNESFVGQGPNEQAFDEFNETFFVGNLGGPIIQNKLFFFVNAEYESETAPLNTGIIDGNAPLGGTEGEGGSAVNVFPVEENVFDEITSIAQNQYGYDPGGFGNITQGRTSLKLLGKLDWNVNPNNRFTFRVNHVDADDDAGISRGSRSFDLSNRQYVFSSVQTSSVAELKTTVSDASFNQARLVYTRIRDQRDVQAQPFPEVVINVSDDESIELGIDRFSQANALDQDLIEFTDDFTYLTGDHSLTFGTSNQVFRFSNLFIQDYYGAYEFDAFNEVVGGDTVTVGAVEAFRRGVPARYTFSYSLLDDPQPRAEFTGYQLGFYAQDQWSASPALTITAGLRLDVPLFPEEPIDNPLARQAFPGYSTTNTASGNLLWSPRLGFNWDASGGARTTQVRGGTGIFSGRTPYVWISNQYSNTGADFGRVDDRLFVNDDDVADPSSVPAFVPSAVPGEQPRPGSNSALEAVNTSEINLISDDFTFPQVWRTNLAVDQQLPWGVIGTVEGLYSKSINEIVYRNLNLVQTGTSAYGRPIYGDVPGFRGFPNRQDERFTNALLLKNTGEGYEYSLTALLRKQSPIGLDGTLSYTYNRAENVNNGTSSRAISNWQYNENLDVNDPRLGTSDFEVRHRILTHLSYRLEYADRFATTLSLIYEGRSGSPFSWIYVGDANADGQSFNDLVYVPEDEGDVRILDGTWGELDRFIRSQEDLNEARGEVIRRNSARQPWRNNLDLNLTQQITTLRGQRLELTANVLNVLNLLNPDWGRVRFARFDNVAIWDFEGYTEDGRPIIEFDEGELDAIREDRGSLFLTSDLASRWQLQLGVRYVF